MIASNKTIKRLLINPVVDKLEGDTELFSVHSTGNDSEDQPFSKTICLPKSNASIEFKFYYDFEIEQFVLLDMDNKSENISEDDEKTIFSIYLGIIQAAQDTIQREICKY